MNDRNIHPIIRYGGPVVGAILVYFLLSSMVGGFQADREAARLLALEEAEVEMVEEASEVPATEAELPETEAMTTTAEITETVTLTTTTELTATTDLAVADDVDEATEITVTTELTATSDLVETEAEVVDAEIDVETDVEAEEADLYAGLPAEIAAFFPAEADAATGEEVVTASGCTACHSMEEGVVQIGPSWYNVGAVAATRVEGQSAVEYLYTSIVAPNEHLVEGFAPNLMPQIYGDTLSDEQIAHTIAYLLTLQGDE